MTLSAKQVAMTIIEQLPEDASLEDIVSALYVRLKIERGLQDAEAGNLIDHADVIGEIDEWLRSADRQ